MGTTKDIRDAVEAELEFDPLVDDADIHVVNISGDVALNGTVPSYPQYLEAAAAAQRVAGVRNVHSHLQVVLPGEDYRDDVVLTTAANNALRGHVRTWAERDAVVSAAWMAGGVMQVRDDLDIIG
jgi:osmotically-inducible protein OsmY